MTEWLISNEILATWLGFLLTLVGLIIVILQLAKTRKSADRVVKSLVSRAYHSDALVCKQILMALRLSLKDKQLERAATKAHDLRENLVYLNSYKQNVIGGSKIASRDLLEALGRFENYMLRELSKAAMKEIEGLLKHLTTLEDGLTELVALEMFKVGDTK